MNEKQLEQTWDATYPQEDGKLLWPKEVVPMVNFALRHFRPHAPILDIPCGDGKNVVALSTAATVVAADTSKRAVNKCNSRCQQLNKVDVVTMEADIYATPFSDAAFYNVFCCDLLGHLPEPIGALTELRKITAPGGIVIATLFSLRNSVLDDPHMSRKEDGSYMFKDQWYFRFYSSADASSLCSNAGFEVENCEEFSWWEDPHPGYRDYRHQHSSWTLALRRTKK